MEKEENRKNDFDEEDIKRWILEEEATKILARAGYDFRGQPIKRFDYFKSIRNRVEKNLLLDEP